MSMADNECRVLAEREKSASLSGVVRLLTLPLLSYVTGSLALPRRLVDSALFCFASFGEMKRLTCVVANFGPGTVISLTIAKDTIFDIPERGERDRFDDRRRNDGE